MARRTAPCTQADMTRLIKAAQDAGVKLAGMKLTREGAELFFGEPVAMLAGPENDWDEVLPAHEVTRK